MGENDLIRNKRQADTTEATEGSGEPVELLVEQPKTGASLGQILGTTHCMISAIYLTLQELLLW